MEHGYILFVVLIKMWVSYISHAYYPNDMGHDLETIFWHEKWLGQHAYESTDEGSCPTWPTVEKNGQNWEHFFEVQEIYNFKMRLEQKVVFQAPFLHVLGFFLQDTFWK